MHNNSHSRILEASQENFKLRLRPLDIELRWLRSFLAQLALPTYLGRPAQASKRTRRWRRRSSGTRTAMTTTNTMTIRTRLARISGAHFDRLAQNCLRWGFHGNWNWNWNDIRSNASQQPPIGEVVLVCHRRHRYRASCERSALFATKVKHNAYAALTRLPCERVAAFEVVSASFQRAANRTADVCYWSSMPGGLSRGIVIVISALFIKSAA